MRCSGPAVHVLLVAAFAAFAEAAPTTPVPAPAPAVAVAVAADTGRLPPAPLVVQCEIDACRPLDAWRLLAGMLVAPPWGLETSTLVSNLAERLDSSGAAEAEILALQFQALTGELDAYPEALAALEAWRATGETWPAAAAFRLEQLRAGALRATGRSPEASEVLAAQGVCRDLLVIGPFGNERGAGLHVAYPPELGFDRAAAVPGKERPVSWRANPFPEAPSARIPLDELLRPSDQAAAYLATAVHAESAREVVLRLGSSGAFKVFLGGVELRARDVERPHRADQDAVVLPLRAGWNQLLVKSCVETGPWSIEMRLTGRDGRPASGLRVDSSQVATPDAGTTPAPSGAPEAAAEALTAHEALAARIDEREAAGDLAGAVDAAQLLALYHLLVHPDDVVARSAGLAAERALALTAEARAARAASGPPPAGRPATAASEALPDETAARYLLARANEPEGASREEMEVNRRLHALHAVLGREPGHVAALLDLAEFSMDESPQPERAGDLTARAVAAAPESWRALRARARWLKSRSRQAEHELIHERALAVPEAQLRQEGLRARASVLRERGRADEAEAVLRQAAGRAIHDTATVSALSDLLIDREQAAEALSLARRAQRARPFAASLLRRAADRLEHSGRVEDAAALVADAHAVCPDEEATLLQRVRLAERAGDAAAALADLADVVRLDPGDSDARRHRELLAEDGERERFEDPWRRDAVALAGGPPPAAEEGEPVEVLDRTTVWRVHHDGTEHVYEHLVLRVLNQGGVKQLDTWGPPRGGGRPHVYNVRVIRPDGSFERAPASRWSWFDLPPLRPGDLVDLEYRIDQQQADVFGEYFGTRHEFHPDLFDGLLPTRRAELVVLAPQDLPVHWAERNAERLVRTERVDERGLRVLSWVATDLPRPPVESRMPGRPEFAPVIDLTTFRDWNAFASWWWSFIQKEFVTTPAMREKVAELTEGLATEAERVAAIARFVGQEIRYNSWPFGTHGYEPFSAATIFERRFGDCKDKSILLRQMLAEIGVEAVPVLINAEWARADEPLDAAMVGHFNHCIAYVTPTDEREGYYLDATADLNPLDYLRADDQGARVLHVTPQGGELHDVPYAPPEENALRRHYTVRLDAGGDGEVVLSDRSNGHFGVQVRSRYGGEAGEVKTRLAAELAQAFGPVEVVELRLSDLEDIGAPAELDARFRAKGLWTPEGGVRTLRPGFDELGMQGAAVEPEGRRRFDVVLDRPFVQETTVHWVLPEGAEPRALPRDVSIDGPGLLAYTQTVRRVPDGLDVSRRFELRTRRVPVAEYGAFRKLLREVELAEARTLALDPPPAEVER